MKQYQASAGLYRGLLYNLVKTGKKASIKLTSSGTSPENPGRIVENLIDYDNPYKIFTSVFTSAFDQWVQVELKDRFIDLKAYALGHNGGNYPRHWDILVSMDGNSWNTLHKIRKNDDSKGCHIFKFTKHIGFIRFFKIINRGMNGENDGGNNALYLSNIDLYGNVVICNDNCTVLPHIFYQSKYCKSNRFNQLSFAILLIAS